MRRYTLSAVTALLVLVPWHTTVRAEPPTYTVTDLGNFGGAAPSIAGINASGEVVGTVYGSQAVRRFSGGAWEPVPGVGSIFSIATGINAAGDIVGYYFNSSFQLRAFRYNNASNTVDEVAPLPGGTMTVGFAINQAGDVVGYSDTATGAIVAFRATPPLAPVALPALGGSFAQACGINDAGQIAGTATTSTGAQHAMRVDNGAAFAEDIVGFNGPAGFSAACAIDGAGRVGGQAAERASARVPLHARRASSRSRHLWLADEQRRVDGGRRSVGWYTVAGGASRAFAHRDADGSFDLNTRIDAPGWVLGMAKAVNATGAIAGEGTLNGAPAAFLLTPVGEVADTTPPVIASVTANPAAIFPPSGQSVAVELTVTATDDSGDAPGCTLETIAAPGATSSDYAITGPLAGTVRAVGGRTYTFTVRCADAANNSSTGSVDVMVTPDTTAPLIASVWRRRRICGRRTAASSR